MAIRELRAPATSLDNVGMDRSYRALIKRTGAEAFDFSGQYPKIARA